MSQVISENCRIIPLVFCLGPILPKRSRSDTNCFRVVPIVRKLTRNAFATKYFRLYSSEDLISVELGGALKNIYAIAAGLADVWGSVQNARGVADYPLLPRMSRLSAHGR